MTLKRQRLLRTQPWAKGLTVGPRFATVACVDNSPRRSHNKKSASTQVQAKSDERLDLSDFRVSRILFALSLLGVLLAANSIASHYQHIGFVYHAGHDWFWKGPYHFRAIYFLEVMEGLLALAVYLYGFDFLFKVNIFQYVGTILYAGALVVPPLYVVFALDSLVTNPINELSTPLFYVANVIVNVIFDLLILAILPLVAVLSNRLRN